MVTEEDRKQIDKVIMQGGCLRAIRNLEKALSDVRNCIMSDCQICFSFEDVRTSYCELLEELNKWYKLKREE